MDTKYFTRAMVIWNEINSTFLMYSEMANDQRSEMWKIAQTLKENDKCGK